MRHARGFFLSVVARAADRLNPAIEGCGNGVPELEECIFLKAYVDKHCLDARLDVADFSFVDAAYDVSVGFPLDRVFFEAVVL